MEEEYWGIFEEAKETSQAVMVEFDDRKKLYMVEKIDRVKGTIFFSREKEISQESIKKAKIFPVRTLVFMLEDLRYLISTANRIEKDFFRLYFND